MDGEKLEDKFPVDVNSRFINFLQQIILLSVKVLALFMTLVIVWSVLDVGYSMYEKITFSPRFVSIEEIVSLLGGFLAVLIAIEIFLNIVLYLRKDMSHTKLVIATALMAIARKVIILDYERTPSWQLIGIGVIILALGIAYWLVKKTHQEPKLFLNEKG